jgi:hypothetical protein
MRPEFDRFPSRLREGIGEGVSAHPELTLPRPLPQAGGEK